MLESSLSISSSQLRRTPKKVPGSHPCPNEATEVRVLNFLRVAIFAFCQRREAGTLWHKQGCSKWCAACALPRLAACAAAAVLTAVLARAEYFTLATAGTTVAAEQQWQLVDDERPRKQRLGAAYGPAGGLAASERAVAADEDAGRLLLTVVAGSLGLAWDAATQRTLHRAPLIVSSRA